VSKQEKLAWVRLSIIILVTAYLINHLFGDNGLPVQKLDDVRGNVVNGIYVLLFLSWYLVRHVKGVDVDERDRVISGMAAKNGFAALSLLLMSSTVVFRLDNYAHWISTRSPSWVELFLILCIAFGWLVEASTSVFHYWRDRHGG
jgi:hypothetical protein